MVTAQHYRAAIIKNVIATLAFCAVMLLFALAIGKHIFGIVKTDPLTVVFLFAALFAIFCCWFASIEYACHARNCGIRTIEPPFVDCTPTASSQQLISRDLPVDHRPPRTNSRTD